MTRWPRAGALQAPSGAPARGRLLCALALCLLAVVLLGLAVAGGSGGTGMGPVAVASAQDTPPEAECSVSPQSVETGETVTIDASESVNALEVEFDVTGNGTWDAVRYQETEPLVVDWEYDEPNSYTPRIRVSPWGDDYDPVEADCPQVEVVAPNEPPQPAFDVDPPRPVVGQAATFDASASADPDGQIVNYWWDFTADGSIDATGETTTWTYSGTGPELAMLTVQDDDGVNRTVEQNIEVVTPPATAACSVEPTAAAPGDTVVIDASASENADQVEVDVDGDGDYEETLTVETAQSFVVETSYEEEGTYTPRVRAISYQNDAPDETDCPPVTVSQNEPPEAAFTPDPRTQQVGAPIQFDASASTDPDGTIEEYRWDFDDDGTPENTTTDPVTQWTYDAPGVPVVRLTVVDDEGATGTTQDEVEVVGGDPVAVCRVEPTEVEPGGTVQVDATGSENADEVRFDLDGDGEYERTITAEDGEPFVVETNYEEPGEYTPSIQVVSYAPDGTEEADCETVVVTTPGTGTDEGDDEPGDEGDGGGDDDLPPILPIVGIGLGLLGLGALYYFVGGGSGGGGGTPKPKPKPKPSGDESVRYETGVVSLPDGSGTLSVSGVGFEPDLVLLRASNAHRTDAATDRTAGWCYGSAVVGEDGIVQRAVTVADDARTTDQATCATADDAALVLFRHGEGEPGRIRCALAETTDDGFDLDVTIPGDDPLAGGIRVCYQAIRTGPAEVELGHFLTPTEPGTQSVDLAIDADHVELVCSSGVTDAGRAFTTDRGVGLSIGRAVSPPDGPIASTAHAGAAWPGEGQYAAAACDDDRVLHLPYQDGDRIAGRTAAHVAAMDEALRLRYERVYSGPHKLGSVARHPVSYLATAGDALRPAIGTAPLPRPGESLSIDVGFEPAMVSMELVGVAPGESVGAGGAAGQLAWSHGTAIDVGEGLRQYVLHDAASPAPGTVDAAAGGGEAPGEGPEGGPVEGLGDVGPGEPHADGGEPEGDGAGASGDGSGTPSVPLDPAVGPAAGPGSVPDPEALALDPAPLTGREDPALHDRAGEDDDGWICSWLVTDDDGRIVRRDELAIDALEDGIAGSVRAVDADAYREPERPTIVYRAWPAADADRSDDGDGAGTGASGSSASSGASGRGGSRHGSAAGDRADDAGAGR